MKKVKALYIGRRIWNDKLVQVFLCNGKEEAWSKISGLIIGKSYATEQSDKKHTMKKWPDEVPAEVAPDKNDIDKWEALESAALERDRRRILSKRYNSNPRYLADFENLKKITEEMNGYERAMFVEFLVNKLSRG